MKEIFTIKRCYLDDYLPSPPEQDIKVYVSLYYCKAEPDVGIMRDYVEFQGWEWVGEPMPQYEDAIDDYFDENWVTLFDS